jgi:hypothetical protein
MNWNVPNGATPLVIHLWNKMYQVMITSNVFRALPNRPAVRDRKRVKTAKRTFSAGA